MPEPTIADRLERLIGAKGDIDTAVTEKGGTVTKGLENSDDDIMSIPTGGDDSGYFIKETLPISFKGDGNNLTDYTIYGKTGGLNGVCPNVYPPIDDYSVNRGDWGTDPTGGLYGEPCYNKWSAWGGVCNAIYLEPGTYTFSVYMKTESATNGIRIYVKGNSNYSPNYIPWAEGVGNGIVCTTSTSYQRFSHTFNVTTAGYVYPRVEKSEDDGNNVFVTCFQLEKGSTASPYVAYNTTGITITVNGSNIFFPLDEPLGPDDRLTMADTGVNIPTINGVNVIDTPIAGKFDMFVKGGISPIQSNILSRYVDFTLNAKTLIGNISTHPVYSAINRCNVSDDGTINAFYGDNSYTEDGSNGQVMVYIPKFYYKVTPDPNGGLDGSNIRKCWWSISDTAGDGYKLHPAFYDASGNEIDYFLYGAFEAVGQNSSGVYSSDYNTAEYKLGSVGGNTYKPIRNLTRAIARTMATNRGTGWYSAGIKQTMAIQMLFAVEYGFNSQVAVGYGVISDTDTHNTGQTVGNITSGTRNNQTTCVNYRGIENIWGNLWNWIDGININDYVPYICDSYSFEDDTATGYTRIGFTMASVTGWVTAFGYDVNNDYTFLPLETTSSEIPSGAIGDYYGAGGGGWCIYPIGGSWVDHNYVGLFDIGAGNTSATSAKYFGARLMYIPTAVTE